MQWESNRSSAGREAVGKHLEIVSIVTTTASRVGATLPYYEAPIASQSSRQLVLERVSKLCLASYQ